MTEVLHIDSVESFEAIAKETNLVEQYAGMSAADWFDGFGHSLEVEDGGVNKFRLLTEYLGNLTVRGSIEFNDFTERMKQQVSKGDAIVLGVGTTEHEAGQLLTAVRYRTYNPRNPFKKPYVYAPDLLVGLNTTRSDVNSVIIDASNSAGISRVVVDAFLYNQEHRNRLEEYGFISLGIKGRHDWQTPDMLRSILGATYPVQQYELVV